ncbi:uncharacterized protein LOC111011465 isoform X2 [Momordica charantia]|uniref:Uncharacterized protein LOC111011465 isoform X2 n=1 Tax=Momordica charantia TaxID=3673 RepID=A0A6J1CJ45_MOMCH|nr:uncharacterized protein LOC111011465 isoform X2 [Momordica charantia]
MNMGFASVGTGIGNGGSSSSFSNLSPLAPPFTLERLVTRPISTPLVDMTEPSFGVGVPLNWHPSSSQTSGLDFFLNPSSEFDWLPLSSGSKYPRSQAMEPADNRGPLFGCFTMSSTDASLYGETSGGLITSIGKAKPYYPSYASTSCNKGCPTVIVDHPSYDRLSNSHVATFDEPPSTTCGSRGSERSVEEALNSIDMLDRNKFNELVRECPNAELLLERNLNIEPVKNSRTSNIDAHSAFPGCHPKTRTLPLNLATSSQNNCQFLKNAPYQEILTEQDDRLSVTTTIVNSPATFSIRPPVVSTDSFVWNIGPCNISDYGYDSSEEKLGGNDLSTGKEFLPVNSESKAFFSTENHGTCIDKNDPVVTESSLTKIHNLPNNIHAAKDSPDRILKTGMGLHIPDASPHFSLDLKTIETAKAIESSSESFDQYNLSAVDSPCWKGAPVSRISPFQAFEIVNPSRVKKVEVCNSVNLPLPQVPTSTAEDTVKVFVHEPNESTIGSRLEKGATSSPKMPSVACSLLAEHKTIDSGKVGDFYSKMSCFHPAINSIQKPVVDGGECDSSCCTPENNFKYNFMSGIRIAPTSCMEKHADAKLNSGNSSEDGLNHTSRDAAEHVQNLPSELAKEYHEESVSKIDVQILVDKLHSLSELLLSYCSNGLDALHQKNVESLETVMSNLDTCINSVRPQGSLSPEEMASQNLGQFHQLHSEVGVLKSYMKRTEGANLECSLKNRNGIEKKNQYILSVKKDKEDADSPYLRNGLDPMKEDSITQALKKVLCENFRDEEGENPQTLVYKNLWLEAEAALCASNLRARFNSAKLEMEKHEPPKVIKNAQNQDELPVPDTSKTKVGSEPHASIKTSPVASVFSQAAGDVMTRFHILKCRDDEAKLRDAENSGTLSDFKVSVEQDMVEKDKKRPAVPYIKDMDFPFPTSKNESGPALPPASPTLSWSNHVDDDVMSRFQVLKSRDECISCVSGKITMEKMLII